jgi:hypothetical protein
MADEETNIRDPKRDLAAGLVATGRLCKRPDTP